VRRPIYLAFFAAQVFLIVIISGRDTLSLIARRLTILPLACARSAQTAENVISSIVCLRCQSANPFRKTLLTYLQLAGIDRGCGYFAPNVPANYRLVFELHYHNGQVEYELPTVGSSAAGLRLASLLDEVGRADYPPLREYLVKTMARSISGPHPDVATVRALFGVTIQPGPNEYTRGERSRYEVLQTYEFRGSNRATEPEGH
jgi:hypothetical protein